MTAAGVFGWPAAHSKSPRIHRFWLQKLGMDGDYSRFAVEPGQLETAVRAIAAMGLSGVNVTAPHKVAIIPLLDELATEARQVGAVNLVVRRDGRLIGHNTDVEGVLEALPQRCLPMGGIACLIGSGGAARAALAAFHRRQVARVLMVARNPVKGMALLREFGLAGEVRPLFDAAPAMLKADVIVNASSLGMADGEPMPRELLAALRTPLDNVTAFDMVYAPLETAFLATAREQELQLVDGLTMLIGQAATAFEALFGAQPPRGHDAELRALLTA